MTAAAFKGFPNFLMASGHATVETLRVCLYTLKQKSLALSIKAILIRRDFGP